MEMEAEMEAEMEIEMEAGVDSTAKAIPVPEVEVEVVSTVKAMEDMDPVKAVENTDPAKAEAVTTVRSCLEMVPTIRNDSWERPPSIPEDRKKDQEFTPPSHIKYGLSFFCFVIIRMQTWVVLWRMG